MASFIYANFRKNQSSKLESFASDTFKCALFTSSYGPNQNTDQAYQVNAPSAPSLSQTAGGSLAGTTYFVKTTYVNNGETTPSSEASLAVSANNLLVVSSPSNPGGSVTGYNVYVSTTSGTETKQNASPISLGSSWTEPTSGLISGTSPPGSNSAQISGELSSGSGYSQGGLTLASTNWSIVPANSWVDSWVANTSYPLGAIIRPASGNGYLYYCAQAGSSGASAPTFGTTIGGLTTDNSVIWQCVNTGLTTFTATNVSWNVTNVLTWRYAIIFNSSTQDLVCCIDPGSNQSSPSSGTININFDSAGILAF